MSFTPLAIHNENENFSLSTFHKDRDVLKQGKFHLSNIGTVKKEIATEVKKRKALSTISISQINARPLNNSYASGNIPGVNINQDLKKSMKPSITAKTEKPSDDGTLNEDVVSFITLLLVASIASYI